MFIILLSELCGYYYTFMIMSAPLTKARRSLELPILGLALLTQFISFAIIWFDDRHALLTLVSLLFALAMIGAFITRTFWARFKLGSTVPSSSI